MIQTDVVLDAKGLACPMPIVKTRKIMKELYAGQVLEVQATDKGSTADLKAWAASVGHQYLGTIEENEELKHYIRKSDDKEVAEKSYPHVVSNEALEVILDENPEALVLDVREAAEYAFGHIPGAQSLPLGDFDEAVKQLTKETDIYVVCRTGNRSDTVAQKLASLGFASVKNVVPGMSEWNGATEKVH